MYGNKIMASSSGSATANVFTSPPPAGEFQWQGALVMNTGSVAGWITFDNWASSVYLPASMGGAVGIPCGVNNLANVQIQSANSSGMSGVAVTMVP